MTTLKIAAVVLFTLAAYTAVANIIPQVESDVPEEIELSDDVSPEQLVALGEDVFGGAGGCTACHGLGTRAPNLLTAEGNAGPIGARCGERVEGMSCKEYLHESLTDPGAYVVEGYAPIMPDASRTLSGSQVWALVAFLEAQGGEVTVSAADLPADGGSEDEAGAGGTAPAGGGMIASATDPEALIEELACQQCHVLNGEGAPLGPPFDGMGARLDAERIRIGILRPNADTAQGYEAFAGTMPPNFGERMTASQLDALVTFLAGLE